MKTKIKILKISLLLLFTVSTSAVMAADPTYYVCAGTTINLGATNLPANTTALWDIKKDGAAFYTGPTAPTSFADAGSYEITLVSLTNASSGACTSDPVTNNVIVLPALALNLALPTNPAYCEANGTATSSEIVASGASLPTGTATDLGLQYTYSVSNGTTTYGGTDQLNGVPLGSIDATTGNYTLTTKVPGTYVITGTVKYTQLASNTTNNLIGNGCPFTSTTTRTVTVTPKPTAPTITIQ